MIGPSKMDLKVVPDLESRGYYSPSKNRIRLRKGMPKSMEAEVLLHEILHAIHYTFSCWQFIPENKNERLVTTYSAALCTVFAQNPWILKKLAKDLK